MKDLGGRGYVRLTSQRYGPKPLVYKEGGPIRAGNDTLGGQAIATLVFTQDSQQWPVPTDKPGKEGE